MTGDPKKKSEKAKLRNKQEIGLSEADVESFFFFIKKESLILRRSAPQGSDII